MPPPSDRQPGEWNLTYTGKRFRVLDPRPEEIDLRDIAHATSQQCRFNGHTREFYSVAEHCVRASWQFGADAPLQALRALFHDAAEAYVGDMTQPLKNFPEMQPFRSIEGGILRAIHLKFGIPEATEEEALAIKRADRVMLVTEARDLMPKDGMWQDYAHRFGVEPLPDRIVPLSPQLAELAFQKNFTMLMGILCHRKIHGIVGYELQDHTAVGEWVCVPCAVHARGESNLGNPEIAVPLKADRVGVFSKCHFCGRLLA